MLSEFAPAKQIFNTNSEADETESWKTNCVEQDEFLVWSVYLNAAGLKSAFLITADHRCVDGSGGGPISTMYV